MNAVFKRILCTFPQENRRHLTGTLYCFNNNPGITYIMDISTVDGHKHSNEMKQRSKIHMKMYTFKAEL